MRGIQVDDNRSLVHAALNVHQPAPEGNEDAEKAGDEGGVKETDLITFTIFIHPSRASYSWHRR